MSEDLKPCPFCGHKTAKAQPFLGYWMVGCSNCFGAVLGKIETKEEAIKAWNNRPSPWHTGTPTEEGEYLVLWRETEEEILKKSVLLWHDKYEFWYDTEMGALWRDEYHAEVVAWRKIEPYKA